MPFDSNGVFSLTPGYLAVTGETIQPTQHNPPLEDIAAQGLSAVLPRDGRAPMIGNLNMGGFKISNLLDGTSAQDAVTKSQLDANAPKIVSKGANYTIVNADYNTAFRSTASFTYAIEPTANLRANFRAEIWADAGPITIDPDSTHTINGSTTLVLQQGQYAEIFKDSATTFRATVYSDARSGPQLQGFATGIALTTNATDAANDVDIAVGAAAADTSPYYLMQLTSALTKRIDANWAVGTNQGGLDTGSVSNATYYIWLIQRSDTGVVDALFSLSSNSPTMPTSYDRKRRLGVLTRASSTNGVPIALTAYQGPLLGTVSQTGGVPTGAVIERGSNSNGTYIKFADGTLICTDTINWDGSAVTTPRGSLFGNGSGGAWTYPAAFAGSSDIGVSAVLERNDVTFLVGISPLAVGTTAMTYQLWSSSSLGGGNSKTARLTAIGRWF